MLAPKFVKKMTSHVMKRCLPVMQYNKILVFMCIVSFLSMEYTIATEADLKDMMTKMSDDTLNFARHMESLISSENKCNSDQFFECSKGNYDNCKSVFPSASCPGNEYTIPICGNGKEGGCGALFDFKTTSMSLAPDIVVEEGNPIEIDVKDTICYSRQAEPYMIEASKQSEEYWSKYSVKPPSYHYGADNGVFRIYPARASMSCPSSYDPRVRPWYVAGSSGPKDIILLLDTSGSMNNQNRLGIMKESAERVINTLGVSDFVAVVPFSTGATQIALPGYSSTLARATKKNTMELLNRLKSTIAAGGTNFYDAFEKAFDIFDLSTKQEVSAGCHRAILFMTDGVMYNNETEFLQLVRNKMDVYRNNNKSPPTIFTYSFGRGADKTIPKQLACENDGIWSQIDDGEDLSQAMGAYYKYFAYGLGDSMNKDFVAWVEPYEFETAVGQGITSSAPVYDRKVEPPVMVGVVGLDFSFVAMERALGREGTSGRETIIQNIVDRSSASCPDLKLTNCQLQALRYFGSNNEGDVERTCSDQCNNWTSLDPTYCSEDEGYPDSFWNNDKNKDVSYVERTCCNVGEIRGVNDDVSVCSESYETSASEFPILPVILGSFAFGTGIAVLAAIYVKCRNIPAPEIKMNTETNHEDHPFQKNHLAPLDSGIVPVAVPIP